MGMVELIGGVRTLRNGGGGDLSQSGGGTLIWQASPSERLRFDFSGAPFNESSEGWVELGPGGELTRTLTEEAKGCIAYTVEWSPGAGAPAWESVRGVSDCPDNDGLMDTRPKIIVQ